MKRNVGGLDRTIRLLVGPALFFAGLVAPFNTIYKVLFIVGGILVFVSGAMGYCLLWTLLGVNTNKDEDPLV